MASILEQMQEALHTIENRVKGQERRISHLEQLVSKQHSVSKWPPVSSPSSEQEKILSKKSFNLQRFELNIGTYLLQSAGVIIFLLGMGFLLKYSIEQGLMQPLTRIIFGLTTATIAVGFSEYLKKRYQQWSLACSAGGVVLYYLSWYAAFAFYGLISLQTVFVCFCAMTLFAVALSLWHNSLFIALFSLIGGFLTPALLQAHAVNTNVLMGYLLVLSFGYLVLSYWKKWFSLSCLSFAFIVWYARTYSSLSSYSLNSYLIFTIVAWFIFSLVPYAYVLFYQPKRRFFEPLLLIVSALFTFFELFTVLTTGNFSSVFWIVSWLFKDLAPKIAFKYLSLFFAGMYTLLLGVLFVSNRKNTYLFGAVYAIVIGSCVGFIVTQWDGYQCSAALHIFGLIIFAISFVFKQWRMRIASYLIWLASSLYLMFLLLVRAGRIESLLINEITLSLSFVFLSFGIAAWLSYRYKTMLSAYEVHVPVILESCAALTMVFCMHTKIWRFPYRIIGLAVYSLCLLLLSLYGNKKLLRQFSYGTCMLAMVYFALNYQFKNLLNPYWAFKLNLLFITFFVVFLSASFLIRRFQSILDDREFQLAQTSFDFLLAFCLFAWVRANIILQFCVLQHQGGPAITQRLMGYSMKRDVLVKTGTTNLFLALFYTLYSVLLIACGLFERNRTIRYLGLAIIILAFRILFEIIWQMPQTVHRIVAFLCVGGLLIGSSFLYQKMSKRIQ